MKKNMLSFFLPRSLRANGFFQVLTVFLLAVAALTPTGDTRAQSRKNPAFAVIEDTPGLPRVLLLGDSISIGYTVAVRKELEGEANVHRPAENCASTKTGKERLSGWLGEKSWDVIHFNFGLHDLKYVMPGTSQIVALGTEGSEVQVSLDDYVGNLEAIVTKLEKTGAQLVWCNTTPVPEGAKGRKSSDADKYNAAALKVMKKHGVAVNDLNQYATPQLAEIQKTADVHFSPEGSRVLAKQVAKSIRTALENAK